jgi:hypothetical protein
MYGLVRLVVVALGRLARAEERKIRSGKIELHEVGHRDVVIAEVERALQRVAAVLGAVTCDVH